MDRLDEIAALEHNWDGYSGSTFKTETISHARRVFTALTAAGIVPDVGPLPNGVVSFEWDNDNSYFEVGATRAVGHVSEPIDRVRIAELEARNKKLEDVLREIDRKVIFETSVRDGSGSDLQERIEDVLGIGTSEHQG